ncbi:EVE domain-containing protein [Kribbella jejuensis]|uniref:EVE domain-containing protein n=2 Tax=Kribbella jejuensis TaxID=236068 RepID=A0A542E7L3_9ACTN|nr:EVE domain-containing protein [Kribbella jejuensis]
MHRAWLGVVSADHTQRAVQGGFIQLNHGKRYGVARLHRGDGFAIYSPTEHYLEKRPLRAFTALGVVADDAPYQAEPMSMGPRGTIQPWRRRIDFLPAHRVPLTEVALNLTKSPNWGYQLRRGLVPLEPEDFESLQALMT